MIPQEDQKRALQQEYPFLALIVFGVSWVLQGLAPASKRDCQFRSYAIR
jgi:hypothetical protein